MSTLRRHSPKVRDRALRMVLEHQAKYPSQRAALRSIAEKMGCTEEALRRWVRRSERDQRKRVGGPLTSPESRMGAKSTLIVVSMLFAVNGCSTTSSSNAIARAGPAWDGPILVSQSSIPAGIEYKVIGSVQADARVGYDSAVSLYPLLAAEAKKIGANAVVNAKGGRRLTLFSWSAAYVSGIAVKVDDPQLLRALPGSFY